MKPTLRLDAVEMPEGGELALYRHDRDFLIKIDGQILMQSRQHESELELALLGCSQLEGIKSPRVLVGGLGMGYSLRKTLDMLRPRARVVVCELVDAVVRWNREHLGELNGHPLADKRVRLERGDVVDLLARSNREFDAILIDIDNGPRSISAPGNDRLYTREGLQSCRRALRNCGCLAVWSAEPSKPFERLLMNCDFHVRRYRVPAYKGSKGQSRFVWVASEERANLPDGGGEPRPVSATGESETGRGRRSGGKARRLRQGISDTPDV